MTGFTNVGLWPETVKALRDIAQAQRKSMAELVHDLMAAQTSPALAQLDSEVVVRPADEGLIVKFKLLNLAFELTREQAANLVALIYALADQDLSVPDGETGEVVARRRGTGIVIQHASNQNRRWTGNAARAKKIADKVAEALKGKSSNAMP
ncbi:MAG: hypothetical protein AB7F96_05215 [Beijerinckiaceae bacterium]